jgi:PKD repeat protein
MIKFNNLLTSIAVVTLLMAVPFALTAADCDSINDELTSKFRFLGSWNQNGTPEYLEMENDEVSESLIDYINTTLPESVKLPEITDEYFSDDVQLNTELKENSKVYLTMVHEGADWKNTLGYYTYDLDNPPQSVYDIDSLVIIFPNVSQYDVVQPGNKVLLGEFPAETGIGYFLIAKGWVGDTICLKSHLVFTDPHLNTFTTPEYQQQTILLNYQPEERFLLGFEDIKRPGGDNDFNDAVFYITAEPGAIDTTDIPVIPTAQLVGDTIVCDENSPVELNLMLTGKAPWAVTITNGEEEQTVSDIIVEDFNFETFLKDSIWIKSFEDARKSGIASGYALVNVSHPTATLNEQLALCNNEEGGGGFIIQFNGYAPFSLTYLINGEEATADGLTENQYELRAEVGKEIQLISMTDKYCIGEVNDVLAVAKYQASPELSLAVDGSGIICEGEQVAPLNLSLDGEGPWTINYLLDDEEYSLEVETIEYQLNIEKQGLVQFTSISDANCTNLLTQSMSITQKAIPTANIINYTSECGNEAATLDLAFGGEGPWSLDYKLNDELYALESLEAEYALVIEEDGLLELISVHDAYCQGILNETQEIMIYETPTAIISGDAFICDEEEATVQIELSGTAPFTIVYSDGENEITVNTEASIFEFTTSEFATYTLISMMDAYCEGAVEGSATISDGSEDLNVEIDAEDIGCFGEQIELALIGETDNLSIEWTTDGAGTLENNDQLTTTYTPLENESGDVEFFAEVTNGCAIKTVSKTVIIIEELSAEFDVSPEKDLLTNSQITFTPTQNGYDGYEWDFGDDSGSNATIASTEYTTGGIYDVQLTVNVEGCEASESMLIEVLSKDELYIPNAFHPYAQNPENQVVKVYGNNIDDNDFYFKIVNRWGKVMYETESFAEANTVGWDGINNNNDVTLELNVFTYIVRGKFIEGNSFEQTGTITQVK